MAEPLIPEHLDLQPTTLRHLPVLRAAIDRLGIREVLDELLPSDPRNEVSDADCVTVMIANILHGRVALYGMGEWLAGTDVDVLLWEGCPAAAFEDDRLGKALDHIFDAGTDSILSAVASRYLTSDDAPSAYTVHADTTSLSLEGAYVDPPKPGAPKPAHGHSKDLRPDLKQLVYGLAVHGATQMPLYASVLDGNTPDTHTNRLYVDKLAALLPPEDDVTLVADCKLVDGVTLGRARRTGFHYVSLVPHSFKIREELVEHVRTSATSLVEVARSKGRTKADPDHVYRATSFVRPFRTVDIDGVAEDAPHRLVVVESSSLAAAFEERLERQLKREREETERAFTRLARQKFEDEEKARSVLEGAIRRAERHWVDASVTEHRETIKRPRAGRPPTGDVVPTRPIWRITFHGMTPNQGAIERERFHARHFLLISDHLDEARWSDARIVETYRAQHVVEGHAGFRWLKDTAKVAPVFLKLPHRIAALGLVFLLALMVRNWMESTVRRRLKETNDTLPDMNDRPSSRPTAEATLRHFQFVSTILVRVDGRVLQRRLHALDDTGRKILRLLGFSPEIFTTPRRKSGGVCGGIDAM